LTPHQREEEEEEEKMEHQRLEEEQKEKKEKDRKALLEQFEQMRAKTKIGGINLGRVWNKNLIIHIFFCAGEKDPQRETERDLWHCSRIHRIFLPNNYTWYPQDLLPPPWWSLKQQSWELETFQQGRFLFDNIRIEGKREVTKVIRIFTASFDGWWAEDFHRHCDGMGPTLCLIRTIDNYLAAGFTSVSWSSESMTVEDPSAMMFALTNEMQAFKTNNPTKAVRHDRDDGPQF